MTWRINTAGTDSFGNKSNKQNITTQPPTCVLCVLHVATVINKSPLSPARSPGEALNSSPSIMTLSPYRSGYDPCTVILISSAPAPAITPSHISGASRPLDNLMMQGSLPSSPPPLLLSLPSLLQGSNFSLFFQTNISQGTQRVFSPRTLLSKTTYLLLFTSVRLQYSTGLGSGTAAHLSPIWSTAPAGSRGDSGI